MNYFREKKFLLHYQKCFVIKYEIKKQILLMKLELLF
jgi:hypothetical protein